MLACTIQARSNRTGAWFCIKRRRDRSICPRGFQQFFRQEGLLAGHWRRALTPQDARDPDFMRSDWLQQPFATGASVKHKGKVRTPDGDAMGRWLKSYFSKR
jgi:hypothetical protein